MSQPVSVNFAPVIRSIEALELRLSDGLGQLDSRVGDVHRDLQLTSNELQALQAQFKAFVEESSRTAAVQRSETKLGSLKSDLDREFGHYAVVRRTSIGILQAFDVGNVTNQVVGQVSEGLMIQTPRYWLAPALVGMAAWSKDDQPMAERSIQEAFSRDPRKTSLFFALVLRRQGRLEASARWLRHYLTALDPTRLTREFAVILEATATEVFGPAAQQLMSRQLDEWIDMLRNRQDIVDAQVEKWRADIEVRRWRLDRSQYPVLAAHSSQWAALRTQVEAASALGATRDAYQVVRDAGTPRTTLLEDALDGVLEKLVTEYDGEELPLRREVAYHEAVVTENGDMDRAQARADQDIEALEETIDAVTLETTAAISPERLGVSQQTQRVAIGTAQSDFLDGISRYASLYRARAVRDVSLELGPQHSGYATQFGFPGWNGSTATPESTSSAQLDELWDRTFAAVIEQARFKNSWFVKPGLIAAGVALVLLVIQPIVGIVALLVGAGAVYYLSTRARASADQVVARARSAQEQAKAHSRSMLQDALAELVDLRLLYQELDGEEESLLALVRTWPTAVHTKENDA